MSRTVDSVITVALFVGLVPLVAIACIFAFWNGVRGYSGKTESNASSYSFFIGPVGIPIATLLCYLVALILACLSSGYTFYYPLVALGVGFVLTLALFSVSERFRSEHYRSVYRKRETKN
ncbi:hypothetical protein I3U51_18080 [Mycobacteroides abscessus subsp. abscessus]|uniref:hypothetical protein n=1 Tax=Mycobacteroides abscessus TaxID=36809 RepID=UPI00092A1E42|nr:hypothetical protein [Mycobacteroides abscessus]MBN7442444.1 hypothetical protein [Mycobacteroides abscessus subsp. abscessus]SIE37166.1 Uncharacterised protein [Mycobacteroides abscessus subsp. abscessus]SLH93908.1 Uncharacterised protein [Mycobacteroides abscessus subsp. abscessus]